MHQAISDRLSEYLDGEVGEQDRVAIERHLADCERCRSDLDGLRAVQARAATLADAGPEGDLWPGVAARIDMLAAGKPPLTAARFSFTLPQLIAASLALMLLSGSMVWLARLGGPSTDFPPVGAVDPADIAYELEVADLQRVVSRGRSALDAETLGTLDQNLDAADQAIRQCSEAPRGTAVAQRECISAARAKKINLLRQAAATIETRSPAPPPNETRE